MNTNTSNIHELNNMIVLLKQDIAVKGDIGSWRSYVIGKLADRIEELRIGQGSALEPVSS